MLAAEGEGEKYYFFVCACLLMLLAKYILNHGSHINKTVTKKSFLYRLLVNFSCQLNSRWPPLQSNLCKLYNDSHIY